MKLTKLAAYLIVLSAVAGCASNGVNPVALQAMRELPDLAQVETVDANQRYRIGASGVCGAVEDDHILVTGIIPGSPADGKVEVGDRIRGLQYRGLGANIQAMVKKRVYRIGRDWDGAFVLTVERPDARDGQGNMLILHLNLPPEPGTLQHFGPTGLYGKMYPDHVVVERVAEGSPAAAVLRAGDQIIAIEGEDLSSDLYAQFVTAIDHAETAAGDGVLRLTVRRPNAAGEIGEELQLGVLGTYSQTAPLDCAKTDRIIAQAADAMIRDEAYGRLDIGLLGLLATGDKAYIEHVGKVLHASEFASHDVELSMFKTYTSWPYGYQLMVMCEYYLLTQDATILPVIEKYAVTIAKGQDVSGQWNHRGANPEANFGQLHGRLYGYGAINQTTISLWISLILAEKCGVTHPEVVAAVDKTHRFYSNWIGKGALPYGNHGPFERFLTNNGTSGSVAVGFSLLGDAAGASFYGRLSAAAWDEVLTGHTGPFFNILWSGLGANVVGPEVMAAFSKKLHWLPTLTRTWDGHFLHMEARGDAFNYSNCSSTGARLLNLCAGRRALLITGRDADHSIWLSGAAAVDAIEAGTIEPGTTSTRSLLGLLGSPLPRVRTQAAELLAVQDADVGPEVLRYLRDGTRDERLGALQAIGALQLVEAADPLMTMVRDETEDLWLRQRAVMTLAGLDGADSYGPDILALILIDRPADTFGNFKQALGSAAVTLLQPDPYVLDLDMDVFYQAVGTLLEAKHVWTRSSGMALIRNIPLTDLYRVADQMVTVIEDKDRSYAPYQGDGQRHAGLEILNRLGIKDVIDLTISTTQDSTGRGGPRLRNRMSIYETFDGNARYAIPAIREALGAKADPIIEQIEASTEPREMISLDAAKQVGEKAAL